MALGGSTSPAQWPSPMAPPNGSARHTAEGEGAGAHVDRYRAGGSAIGDAQRHGRRAPAVVMCHDCFAAGDGRRFAESEGSVPEPTLRSPTHSREPAFTLARKTRSACRNSRSRPRRSAKVTHFCSFKLTHTKNTICNTIWRGANSGPAVSRSEEHTSELQSPM